MNSSNNNEISLVVPTYNESLNIEIFLNRVNNSLIKTNKEFEIIIIDDNSPDKTWEIATNLSHEYRTVKVIRRFHERGLSSAVIAGMEAASGNILIVMDADLQHDETIIPDMITKIEKSDIVIASRSVSQFGYGKFSLHRKMLSKVANLLARILFGIKSKDPLSGYFAIRREVFEELSPKINPRGFKILLEFLARARNKKVDEVGYIFKERVAGETKLNSIVMLDFIVALLDIILAGKLSPTFIKYSFIGLSGIIVNLFGQFITNFLFHLDSIQLGYFVLSLGVINGFILSAISNFILNNYWTFRDNKLEGSLALQGFFTFLIIACIGLLIQISVWRYSLGIVIQFLESKSFNIANLSCNLLGILAATASNYALSKKLTWKN